MRCTLEGEMTKRPPLRPSEMAREDLEQEVLRLREVLGAAQEGGVISSGESPKDTDGGNALQLVQEELREFLHLVSHDAKAPLRHIRSFGKLLSEKHADFDEESRLWMAFVTKGATRMDTLLDALLTYSRVGSRPLALRALSLENLANRVIHASRDESFASLEIQWGERSEIVADETKMRHLVGHILENAVLYARPTVTPRMKIDLTVREDAWHIQFSDNGVGIESSAFERIFEPGKRLAPPDELHCGMGLAICRKVARRHGGEMGVVSEVGAGSDFWVRIPRHSDPL